MLEMPKISSNTRVPEILAPAGGRAQFFAALNAGADAVYLGLHSFNARARAENFSPDDLRELVPLAHAYGMQVLVTLNILIKELEIDDLLQTLSVLEDLAVDAIIVQDLGVARIAREFFPGLRLHASTQMAVHNRTGVTEAIALGFRRVVLARELTHQEMRRIRAAFTREEVEIEAFCHGSLCYSYSGLCFFSGAEDARSGNRGECAYTCRQPYKILNEPGHGFLFSMRDLDTSASLELMVAAGIDTLKIEGRKKDAQYVASTVRLYRERLDQIFGRPTLRASAPRTVVTEEVVHAPNQANALASVYEDLSLSFQRRGTSFFLKGRYVENVIDLDNPTHRGILVGTVEQVQGRRFRVRTQCALERYDGLRIEEGEHAYHSQPQHGAQPQRDTSGLQQRYDNERLEFSLRQFSVDGKTSFTAIQDSLVEIELDPQTRGRVQVGDRVYKTRSADLKRRVEALAQAPRDYKLKPQRQVHLDIDIQQTSTNQLQLTTTVYKPLETLKSRLEGAQTTSHVICSADLSAEAQRPRSKARLQQDLQELFSVFGQIGFTAEVKISGDSDWFVPRSTLKQLKLSLMDAIAEAYEPWVAKRLERARKELLTPLLAPLKSQITTAAPRFSYKTDRLESLQHLAQHVAAGRQRGLANCEELVFEPKRAFLPEIQPQAFAAQLHSIAEIAGIKVRLALPTVVRAWDEPLLQRWFQAAHAAGIRAYECGNLGAVALLKEWQLPLDDLSGDFTLYTLNSSAHRHWQDAGMQMICLSVEDDLQNIRAQIARLSDSERQRLQVILYKDTPLFIAEACSLTALHDGCPTAKVCGYRTLEIENPKGERFYVAHESCKSIVYGKDAYSILHRQSELQKLGIQHFRLDFLTRPYTPEQIDTILAASIESQTAPMQHTHSANFARTLL